MAMVGRKPKPPELKLVEGNPGHRAIPDNTPKPPPKRPSRPSWILPEAKREWNRIVPQLERLGLLTSVDRAALAGYCQAWARYRQAEEMLDAEGFASTNANGNVLQHPAVSISRNMLQQVRAFAAEFGLTPSSRGRIQIPGQDEDDGGLLD